MGIRARIDRLINPRLPDITPAVVTYTDLDSRAAASMDQLASIAYAISDYQIGKPQWPTWNTETGQEAHRKLALIYRCTGLISHAVGTAKIRVYDEANDDETIPDHPMRQLIRQPNRWMGEARFWGVVALRAATAGYCVVEKERNVLGDVIALNPLRSAWLKAIPKGRGVVDWEYQIPQTTTVHTLKAVDVVPFIWADSPDGSPYGIPPIATCLRDVSILDKLTNFLAVLFERGGVPQWMLFPKLLPGQTLDQGEVDAMTEAFLQRRGGIERRAIPWIAAGFERAERLSYDPAELAMDAVRDISDLAICQAFGVPPRKAGVRAGLEHTTQNATAAVEDGEFYRDTIVPLWTRFDDALTTSLLPEFVDDPRSTISLEFDKSDVEALQEDRNEKARAMVIPGFAGGLLTNHMALRELGISVPDGLPEYFLRSIAVEAIPVEAPIPVTPSTTTTPAPVPPQTQPEGQDGALGALRMLTDATLDPVGRWERQSMSNGHHGQRTTYVESRLVAGLLAAERGPSERLANIGQANRKAHIAIAKGRTPSLSAYFAGLGERVLGKVTLSTAHSPAETLALSVGFWSQENKALLAVLEKLYLLCGTTAFDNASTHVGVEIDWSLSNPKVRELTDKLALRVKDITDESRTLIANAVTRAAEQGSSIEELKTDLKSMFEGWSDSRAEKIARTESQVSYNKSSLLAYSESGVVEKVKFFDSPTHCEGYGASDGLSCCERNGLIVELDKAEKHINAEHPNGSLACAAWIGGD